MLCGGTAVFHLTGVHSLCLNCSPVLIQHFSAVMWAYVQMRQPRFTGELWLSAVLAASLCVWVGSVCVLLVAVRRCLSFLVAGCHGVFAVPNSPPSDGSTPVRGFTPLWCYDYKLQITNYFIFRLLVLFVELPALRLSDPCGLAPWYVQVIVLERHYSSSRLSSVAWER